jgi:hypothetical protein
MHELKHELPIPKYCTAQEWPDAEVWLIRVRNPTLLARAEYNHPARLILHCWPPSAENATTRHKFSRIIADLATVYRQPVSQWSFQFDGRPPNLLMLRAARGEWTGILRPETSEIWHIIQREPLILLPDLSPPIISYFLDYQTRAKTA